MDTTLQDPLVGRLLDGRYRVDARIAVGGMATVYRALDTRLDRELALKVMHPDLATDAAFVERFMREAKSVARLAHPNVVGVFDQGADGAYVYLAMEYVPGCTLRDVLRERGALRPRAALDVLEPVLAALGAAHRAGFVHRDMKPENVLIGDDGRVKVADFGLVRAVGSVTDTSGAVLGTVSYLAPEQIEHGTADTRADVYACGVVLYEMLTGGKPHSGDTPAQVLYQHLNTDVPAPSAAVPGLAVELDELVAAATARNPDLRPYDAVELLARTREARAALGDEQLDAEPPQARAQAVPDGAGDEDPTSVIPRVRPLPVEHTSLLPAPAATAAEPAPAPRRGPRRPRGPLLVVAAVLLALGIGSGVWYINSGQFTRVPAVLGQTEAQATQRLADAGLEVGATERAFSDVYERGTVMAVDPAPGERIRGNGTVTLTLSRGPRIVKVPNLKGTPLAEARKALAEEGLATGVITYEFSRSVAQGAVIGSDPEPGTERNPDSAVALVVSKGAPIEVPSVTGESVEDATATLQEAGLKVVVAPERIHSPEEAGSVAAQSLAEGSRAAKGDTITLTVSKGPKMVEVPDVVGMKTDEARAELEDAGFEVKVEKTFPYLGDTVAGQSVEGGSTAAEGSTVSITIKGL
ncbi:Stk1 family PASTA domain-containing Ser/Thr kinase [Streptomyces roseicoloratus]|uniref:non-specific serine/threonine protein kinase n=1 Tax=Streptomyces roseicoloratus TaxID=2508722 RepID=A0ABY9S361_9ACTN|nr:Stk1 family PASTA domain-containing Ser/Thr kinase [Streptomyces roseicoloratus]WMX47490.1 Stk1 family PASTA domain-containing Ser/Thr kinase [Streptomyces roseicoloratus]